MEKDAARACQDYTRHSTAALEHKVATSRFTGVSCEEKIARNKARLADLGISGLAGNKAGMAPEQPCIGPPPHHHNHPTHQVDAARASATSQSDFADAGAINVGSARDDVDEMQTVVAANTNSAAALENVDALEAKNGAAIAEANVKVAIADVKLTKAALAEAKAALAEKRLAAANAAAALGLRR